jgi:peptidyl-tRNA hydrolase, PTH1 family
MDRWLVAGLGNPGDRYARTRHNAGAVVADLLASGAGERFRKARFVPVETAEIAIDGRKAWLAKSLRFMNESGPSYASIAKKHDVTPDHVIAVHDEIDLPFGALKVKIGGSTAGHNGLKSLQQSLRTPDFLRVRVGVGRPPGRQDPADYVLQPFAKREEADVAILIDAAADAVRSLILEGLAATQDKHNRSGARD